MYKVSPNLQEYSRWCHWIFQWHISFQPHHGPGVDSTPSENVYQEHFWG